MNNFEFNRRLAMSWWNSFTVRKKQSMTFKYLDSFRQHNSLTGREIERIFNLQKKNNNN